MVQLTYIEKLVHSVAIVVADAVHATVEEDELTLAMLFIRNHITTRVRELAREPER
jgi:hypothetical protein